MNNIVYCSCRFFFVVEEKREDRLITPALFFLCPVLKTETTTEPIAYTTGFSQYKIFYRRILAFLDKFIRFTPVCCSKAFSNAFQCSQSIATRHTRFPKSAPIRCSFQCSLPTAREETHDALPPREVDGGDCNESVVLSEVYGVTRDTRHVIPVIVYDKSRILH